MSKKYYCFFGGLLTAQEHWLNKMSEKGYRLIRAEKILYEFEECKPDPVSYTHLDVYKRQLYTVFQIPGYYKYGSIKGRVFMYIPVAGFLVTLLLLSKDVYKRQERCRV